MMESGKENVSNVDRIIVNYLTRLLNNEEQFYRFVIGEDTWEMVCCPNIAGTQFVLRKMNKTIDNLVRYSDDCEIDKYCPKTGIWPLAQKFREHLVNHYKGILDVRTY